MATFNVTYTFRPTTPEQEAKKRKNGLSEDAIHEAVAAGHMEKLVEGDKVQFKRKPVTCTLNEPEVLAGVQDPLVRELVLAAVKDYVKAAFVDIGFDVSIGSHDWETIKTWREENGRSAAEDSVEFTDEDAATCAGIFAQYWSALGKAAVGELFAQLCTDKCSWASVKKNCPPKGKQITVELVAKYRDKFAELAEGLKAEQPTEAALVQYLADVLQKHIDKRFVVEDAAGAW